MDVCRNPLLSCHCSDRCIRNVALGEVDALVAIVVHKDATSFSVVDLPMVDDESVCTALVGSVAVDIAVVAEMFNNATIAIADSEE